MMSFSRLLVAVAALSLGVLGEIENYAELWNKTVQQIPAQDPHITAELSCKPISFEKECNLVNPGPAESVHLLTPFDISYIAAIGDSITAGFGAKASSVLGKVTTEFRGVSWCIGGNGGDLSCATLPNAIREFNPNLAGFSTGQGDSYSEESRYNVAVSGAESKDIQAQAERLVDKMKKELSDDFYTKWKLVTLWIGGNDLCRSCNGATIKGDYTATEYVNRIKQTLIYLRDNLPMTLVNVPQVLDVTKIASVGGLICSIVHWFACDCATERPVENLVREYQEALWTLYDDTDLLLGNEKFTFVIQPFFIGVDVPRKDGSSSPDMDFFAPDCFHMSVKGHRALAAGLWNNMIVNSTEKHTTWTPYSPVLRCPPDPSAPYFYTEHTEALLAQNQAFNSDQFGKPSSSEEEEGEGEGGRQGADKQASLGLVFGYIAGPAVGVYLVAVALGLVGGVIWWRRRKNSGKSGESIPLVKQR